MNARRLRLAAAQIFAAVVVPLAWGQGGAPSAQTPRPYTLHAEAQAGVLGVVVTDKNGKIVANLSRDDFSVYENRVPQTIASLDYSSSVLPPPDLAVHSTEELDRQAPNAPVDIIVLDEINTLFEDEAFARYSLKKFLNSHSDVMPPTMLVAVNMRHFMVLQDYTTSKNEILAALERHLADNPWQMKTGSWKSVQFNSAVNSLMEVAQATAGHPGHKTMIWVGRGFPPIDPMVLLADQAAALKSMIEACTNALRDGRVVLYTLDPAGLITQTPPVNMLGAYVDDPLGGQVDFNAIAKATGGASFRSRNDIDKLIATSETQGSSFYTLSYVPVVQTDDAKPFRNIRVVMKNPELHASTREGYYPQLIAATTAVAQTPGGKLSERLIYDLTVAGQGLMVYDAVPLTIVREQSNPDSFLIRMKAAEIPWKAGDAGQLESEVTVFIESFDRRGKALDRNAYVAMLRVPGTPGQTTPALPTISIRQSIPTKMPAARLRFVVRLNANGKIGTENFFLVDQRTLADPTTGLKAGHP